VSARNIHGVMLAVGAAAVALSAHAQETPQSPTTAERPGHHESADAHADKTAPVMEQPPLPAGMTLDEVLEYSANPPPGHFPDPVPDDQTYVFTFIEQLEYRIAEDGGTDHLGWEAQGWVGGDFHKFWWKSEGEAAFDGADEGESETDFLYSRLVTPFWNFQAGVQYANEWGEDYEDRWSAVIALQGLAPYKFELDNSVYLSEDGDLTLAAEGEYDLRITQRLVLQPRAAVGISAQDIPERGLGSGVTDVKVDLRLRYEFRRELAPYLLARYTTPLGETKDIAVAAGADTGQWFFGAGLRFAF